MILDVKPINFRKTLICGYISNLAHISSSYVINKRHDSLKLVDVFKPASRNLVVVVNTRDSHACLEYLQEINNRAKFWQEKLGYNLTVIVYKDDVDKILKFAERKGWSFPLYASEDFPVYDYFRTDTDKLFLLFDENGQLEWYNKDKVNSNTDIPHVRLMARAGVDKSVDWDNDGILDFEDKIINPSRKQTSADANEMTQGLLFENSNSKKIDLYIKPETTKETKKESNWVTKGFAVDANDEATSFNNIIGLEENSSEVQGFIASLGEPTGSSDIVERDKLKNLGLELLGNKRIIWYDKGIEVYIKSHGRKMIVYKVTYHNKKNRWSQYDGQLPNSIDWNTSRTSIKNKFNASLKNENILTCQPKSPREHMLDFYFDDSVLNLVVFSLVKREYPPLTVDANSSTVEMYEAVINDVQNQFRGFKRIEVKEDINSYYAPDFENANFGRMRLDRVSKQLTVYVYEGPDETKMTEKLDLHLGALITCGTDKLGYNFEYEIDDSVEGMIKMILKPTEYLEFPYSITLVKFITFDYNEDTKQLDDIFNLKILINIEKE